MYSLLLTWQILANFRTSSRYMNVSTSSIFKEFFHGIIESGSSGYRLRNVFRDFSSYISTELSLG